jgi:hypothetical protein
MNAKITLTVPMEKVPREINRILNDLTVELEELLQLTRSCINNADHLATVNKIDDIRKRLSLVDFNYEDCYTILVGLLRYEAEKRLKDMTPPREQINDTQSNG